MSDLTFEQMLEDNFKTLQTGEVVEGTIIDVKPDEAILNIGYKSDGILTKHEYTNEHGVDLTKVLNLGDTMEVKVLKVNDSEGQVILTYKRLAADRGNKRIEEAYNNKEVITATVSQVLDGGLCVIVEDVKIFIPASLVSNTYEKNLGKYAGEEIQFLITEYNPRRRRYIGDRRQILNAERAKLQQELFARIAVDDVIEDGIVKNVTDFGAFVDIGGADGLLHISEMSWGRVENPRKHVKSGDVVRVFIKDINGQKIALSSKFPDANPWKDATDMFSIGTIVTGRVARMTDFGAFVELKPGVDALLHVSQIAREHIEKPSDILRLNEIVTAKVVDFNENDHKISLSIKALLPAESPDTDIVASTDDEVTADVVSANDDSVVTDEVISEEAATEEVAEEVAEAESADEVEGADEAVGDDEAVEGE
ncbi:MAG: S1 RNA-binding domain-containing protein [Lachnospiraceae bacterium]|jgi:ribosomal protein S1|nr:S1 RNA-binding domain-containing protein [Lachnospiraceae bacterium]